MAMPQVMQLALGLGCRHRFILDPRSQVPLARLPSPDL